MSGPRSSSSSSSASAPSGASLNAHLKGGVQRLPEIAPLRRLSPSVVAVLGLNPGPFSLSGTNTYLVGTGQRRILIDTGEGHPEYVELLERAMSALGVSGLQEIVVTHWHHDHLGGVPSVIERFGEVPVRKFMPAEKEASFFGEGAVDPFTIWPEHRFVPLADGERLCTDGATLRVIYTPGHANDHVALLHEEEGAIFTGDCVLGVGTAVFRDLAAYMASLERLLRVAESEGVGILHPAHGPVIRDAREKLAEYIAHRHERVEQVRVALSGAPEEGITCEGLARRIYAELPEGLVPAAAGNTLLALLKLERDGAAERVDADEAAADAEGGRPAPSAARASAGVGALRGQSWRLRLSAANSRL